MELEEMKNLWGEMTIEIEKQKKITDSLVIKMIQAGYRSKINKIWIPEAAGALVCLAGALFILVSFRNLNTWYLLLCGIVSVFILLLLPFLSVRSIRKFRSVNIADNNYRQSLLKYSEVQIQFVFVQKLSFYLGAILMLTILPVMGQLIAGKDLFVVMSLWFWYAIGFPFFYAFSRWVFKKYIRTTADAEGILKELED